MLINLKMLRATVNAICACAIVCLLASFGFSAVDVDTTFNAVPEKDAAPGNVTLVAQPDGKILVSGGFQVVNGTAAVLARLNPDGTSDASFNCTICSSVNSFALQANGKIVISTGSNIYRLNSDGSQDSTFNSPFVPIASNRFVVVEDVQADGKVYVSQNFVSGGLSKTISRLNADGSADNSFASIGFDSASPTRTYLNKFKALPDGKVLIAGVHPNGYLFRLNNDGTRDTTFEAPNISNNTAVVPGISDFGFQSNGKLVFTGNFSRVNGVNRDGIARFNTDGSVDAGFIPPPPDINGVQSTKILILPDDKIINIAQSRLRRLNADGSLDTSYVRPQNLASVSNIIVEPSGGVLLYGGFVENNTTVYRFARLNADGSLGSSFNPIFGISSIIARSIVQPDGKLLLSGNFVRINGSPRQGFARVYSDGTTDANFNTGTGFNVEAGYVVIFALQTDGKILVGGRFTQYNGTTRRGIARLNADGSLDTSFNPLLAAADSPNVSAIAVQPDGKILIGGYFTSVNAVNRQYLARLNADGSVDESFNVTITEVTGITVQTDGKILVTGTFTGVNGFNRSKIARLNANGSLDASFNAGIVGEVLQVEIQPDGKYLLARFIATTAADLIRLNADGTTDSSFQSPVLDNSDRYIRKILLLNNGGILISGDFTSVSGIARRGLALLKADGTLDLTFNLLGLNGSVSTFAKQADGKVFIGGDFTRVGNFICLGVARLNITQTGSSGVLFDFDGDAKSDVSVFRPANGIWYRINSQNGGVAQAQFGQSGDAIAPADYDGDGKTDLAVWRTNGTGQASFYIFQSATGTVRRELFGETGDFPVSGDWDGDGKADVAVFRNNAVGSQSFFYYRGTLNNPNGSITFLQWGTTGDKPLTGDFDGDGKRDMAVFRPANGTWYVINSSNNQFFSLQFGLSDDVPVPADYDGDGKTDVAVFRPSSGTWYRTNSLNNAFSSTQFGQNNDVPVAGDYDGDGKADIAVWRPANGVWYQQRSSTGFGAVQFGQAGDAPVEGAYNR